MKAKIVILGTILCIASFNGCEEKEEEKRIHSCPTCADNITWESYGDWTLQKEGWDGKSGGDEGQVDIIKDCGWSTYKNYTGGWGSTYQVQSCNEGAILTWAYGSLNGIELKEGWTGSTKEGIKLGDDMEKFKQTYSQFTPTTSTNPEYSVLESKSGIKLFQATFSKEKKLIKLYIRTY